MEYAVSFTSRVLFLHNFYKFFLQFQILAVPLALLLYTTRKGSASHAEINF